MVFKLLSLTVTTVFLIRHAHSEWSRGESRSLSKQGTAAAELLAARLSAQPIMAIYSSPSRRTVDTVAPLAERLRLEIIMVEQLRERDVPAVPLREFEQMIKQAWQSPESSPLGGESNVHAQKRGGDVLHKIVARHPGHHIVVSTHGNLLALMLNALDRSYGYEFWRHLSFPDVYRLTFEGGKLSKAERDWDGAAR
jgi:2,3-bisphosphoglycerate-dependent phosphoglycerate mutase